MQHPIPLAASRFCDLDDDLAGYDQARVAVVPLPYDATTSFHTGTRQGPAAILAASREVELFDPELGTEPARVGIATLRAVDPDVSGPQAMVEAVRAHCRDPVRDGKFVLGLGGEHTVTIGCVQAQLDAGGDDLCVLQIDAHADLRHSYQKSPYSHACVARRLSERIPVTAVGIRSWSIEENEFMQENGMQPFSMDRIHNDPGWIDAVVARLGRRVYLTVDLDGLDPAVCPGVGTPEPGGLDWFQLLALLRRVFAQREVVAADVVECLPLPGQVLSEFVAARLAYKLIGYKFADRAGQG